MDAPDWLDRESELLRKEVLRRAEQAQEEER